MRRVLSLWISLSAVCSVGQCEEVAKAVRLDFDVYDGYFVSNRFEPKAAESFVVVADQKQFDRLFGIATVMWDAAHRLPKDAFKTRMILAVIKRGGAVWEYEVEEISALGGAVEIRYKVAEKRSDSAAFACPLIVSIPRGDYASVRFVENGETKKNLRIEPRRSP